MEDALKPKNKHELESLQILKKWKQQQPHLPMDFDDGLLLIFIRGTKSLEIAKEKIDAFCALRTKSPQYFTFPNCDPLSPEFKKSCNMGKMYFLPKTTPEGYRIMLADFEDFSQFDCFKFHIRFKMTLEAALSMWSDSKGMVLAFDSKNVDSNVIFKMSIAPVLFNVQYTQSTLPLKLKRSIVYNAPSFIERFVNIFVKPFMKKKIADRVVFTSKGSEKLKDYIPIDLLPSDLISGGKLPTSHELNDEWQKILEGKRDWFLKASQLCTDETKRPADKAHTFGVNDTLRVMGID